MIATFVLRRFTVGTLVRSSNHVSFPNVFGHLKDQDVNGRFDIKMDLTETGPGSSGQGRRGRAFVSTVIMNFILQKFNELHTYLLRIIPTNCTFATKYVTLVIIYIPLNPLAPELFFFKFQHTLYIKCE